MITFKRADHIHICVPAERLEEARVFYKDVMGLKQIERPKELDASRGLWFAIGDIELHIGVEPHKFNTRRHTAFEVENVKRARAFLLQMGVDIVEEPYIPGRERFAFIDPFGNKMELLERV